MAGDKYLIYDPNGSYFITCTVVDWVDIFTRQQYKDIIVEAFKHCINHKGLVLNGWVIMSNHLHFVGRCEAPHKMSDFLRDFKKFTSKKLILAIKETPESRRKWLLDKFKFAASSRGRSDSYKLWKSGNHAINLFNIDPMTKLEYIHQNPVKAGLVFKAEDYIYSSAIDYAGGKGLIDIEMLSY